MKAHVFIAFTFFCVWCRKNSTCFCSFLSVDLLLKLYIAFYLRLFFLSSLRQKVSLLKCYFQHFFSFCLFVFKNLLQVNFGGIWDSIVPTTSYHWIHSRREVFLKLNSWEKHRQDFYFHSFKWHILFHLTSSLFVPISLATALCYPRITSLFSH